MQFEYLTDTPDEGESMFIHELDELIKALEFLVTWIGWGLNLANERVVASRSEP